MFDNSIYIYIYIYIIAYIYIYIIAYIYIYIIAYISVTGVSDRGGAHYFFGFFCFTELRMTFGYQLSCIDDVFWLLFAGIMALAKQFSLPNLGFWFLWCGRRNLWTPRFGRKKIRQGFPECGRTKTGGANRIVSGGGEIDSVGTRVDPSATRDDCGGTRIESG